MNKCWNTSQFYAFSKSVNDEVKLVENVKFIDLLRGEQMKIF